MQRRPTSREKDTSGRFEFARRTVARPANSIVLRAMGTAGTPDEQWELQCRDGWEWRQSGAPDQVLVRVATLTPLQAQMVQGWLERIKDPAQWWAVSRELQSPDSAPEVARELRAAPWLTELLPALLEASTDGSPPPPPKR